MLLAGLQISKGNDNDSIKMIHFYIAQKNYYCGKVILLHLQKKIKVTHPDLQNTADENQIS